MSDFKTYAQFLYTWEGGFVNNSSDRGGATNRGVTLATYKAFRGGEKTTATDLRNMTRNEWNTIMQRNYWDRVNATAIKSQAVANMLADWAVNSGPATAVKKLQRIVGTKVDGILGQDTLNAVNRTEPAVLFRALRQARLNFLEAITRRDPSQAIFLAGWTRRVKALRFRSFVLNDKTNTEIFFC